MNNYGGRQNFISPPTGFGPRHSFQSTPKSQQNNHFQGRSPHPRSQMFINQRNMHNPRNLSPYHQVFSKRPEFTSSRGSPEQWNNRSYSSNNSSSPYFKKSFTSPGSPEQWNIRSNRSYSSSNSSSSYFPKSSHPAHISPTSSPQQWSNRSNRSYSSDNSSSSYFGDVSQQSSYNSPNTNSGNSFHRPNKNNRYQEKQRFGSSKPGDSSNPGHLDDISLYVHPSMLEDPWKSLMAGMETKG